MSLFNLDPAVLHHVSTNDAAYKTRRRETDLYDEILTGMKLLTKVVSERRCVILDLEYLKE